MAPFLATEVLPISNKDLLSWIFDDMPYDIDKPMYIDAANPTRSISNRQAKVIIRQLVAGFHAAGLKKGDCVVLHAFNDIFYSMIFLGIIAAGGIYAGTNPGYTSHELIHHIKTAKAKFIITEPEMLGEAMKAADACGIQSSHMRIFNVLGQPTPSGFQSYEELLTHGEKDWVRFDSEELSRTTTAARLFSSGTTGLPKAAIISHRNFIAEHTFTREKSNITWDVKRLIALPMFHAAINFIAHTTTLKSGDAAYIMRRFELEPFLRYVEKYNVTELSLVPPLAIAIIMSDLNKKYSLKSIRTAGCGAAAMSKETQSRVQSLLAKGANFNQVWGMTETSCIATMFSYPEWDTTGSVGRPVANLDMKLVDAEGRDITGYNVTGELCVRGPTVISGYFENPAANAESFDKDGFFATGDIMYCDGESKKWYVVDRKKELIKVRGFQVAPPELESVLLSHPNIVDAAVIGVVLDGDESTESPRAYVVRRPGSEGAKLTEEDVLGYMEGKLAKFKTITGGVVFLDAIPKNASGKILKRILREQAKKELTARKAKL